MKIRVKFRLFINELGSVLEQGGLVLKLYASCYEGSEGDLNSLADQRLSQVSRRRASGGEIDALIALYQSRFIGWTVKHF